MTESRPVPVGLIGCGVISGIYLQNCASFPNVEVVACADLDLDRAQAQAATFGISRVCSVDELLDDPEIEIVLNLTVPMAHAEINLRALSAGKNLYSEKPLAINREDGRQMLDLAAERGLLIGCAPDTFFGSAQQTCRRLIDDGAIGRPLAATAFMMGSGPESWHPSPGFFYQVGAGPMFDMGPYYLTSLINLLGPIRSVAGIARISRAERRITSKPRYGETIRVETPSHVAGLLDFEGGAVGTLITSFDIAAHTLPNMEIYGTEGTLQVPDPNVFQGAVRLRTAGSGSWQDVTSNSPHRGNLRGLGLADMADALQAGRPPRASGQLAFHVLDAMQAFLDSAEMGTHIQLTSTCEAPEPLEIEITVLPEGESPPISG